MIGETKREECNFKKETVTEEQRNETVHFLKSYKLAKSMIRMLSNEESAGYYEKERDFDMGGKDEKIYWRARAFEVKRLILSISDNDEKMLLYHIFIKDMSVNEAAEAIHISRRTAFRIKKRAIDSAADRYIKIKEGKIINRVF